MQIDVGFGDAVHPAAVEDQYPVLLDHPIPTLRLYPPETVMAEKVEAMIHLGALNSRMKDFYDVWRLSKLNYFDGSTLLEAIRKTLENRKTAVIPFAELSGELSESNDKQLQWVAFVKKSMVDAPDDFADVLEEIGGMLSLVLDAISSEADFDATWNASGPWKIKS